MATYNLGRILPVFKGEWDADTIYQKLDIVSHNNSSYVATGQSINSEPTSTNPNWSCVAQGVAQSDVQNVINQAMSDKTFIQSWLRLITHSESEYASLSDKSGIHFVYPD